MCVCVCANNQNLINIENVYQFVKALISDVRYQIIVLSVFSKITEVTPHKPIKRENKLLIKSVR